MAIRGAGASGDGPGGLKTGVLRQFKVGFAARSERPPATSILTVIKRDFEVLEGQTGQNGSNMSLSKHVKMGQLIGRGVSELIGE